MKMTLSASRAAALLAEDKNNGFTYSGAEALAEYLEQLEEDAGEEIEFDAVALRCDYSQHDSLQSWAEDYFSGDWLAEVGADIGDDPDDIDEAVREYINDHGQLIEFEGGIIVSSF